MCPSPFSLLSSAPAFLVACLVSAGSWTRQSAAQPPGSVDTGFSPDLAQSLNASWINALAVQEDGRILVAGTLWNSEGAFDQGLLRLNLDGTRDESFQPKLSRTQVHTLLVQRNGKIIDPAAP